MLINVEIKNNKEKMSTSAKVRYSETNIILDKL